MQNRLIGTLGGVFMAFAVSGCAPQIATLQDFEDQPSRIGLNVVDARSAEDKSTEHMSLLITSCDYAIRRIGDDKMTPSRIALLRRDLENALESRLANTTVTVTRYRVFLNRSVAARDGVFSGKTGLVAAVMKNMGSRCSKEETTAGWYAGTEVTTPYSPIIVELDVVIADKSYSVRTVYSPNKELPPPTGEPDTAAALFAAMRQATKALVEKISLT